MDIYTTLIIIAINLFVLRTWLYAAHISRTSNSTLRGKRICLLIAHPDDEAMFFSPTLLALTHPDMDNHVKILCLSNGNADGLGTIREKELIASAETLGLRSKEDVLVLDSPDFVDSMTTQWDRGKVAQILSHAFSPSHSKAKTRKGDGSLSSSAPTVTIDMLVTFDAHGVSSHPNHISLYHGAKEWLAELIKHKENRTGSVDLYTLTSVSLLRKYISLFDAPLTFLFGIFSNIGAKRWQSGSKERRQLSFISDIAQWRQSQSAMTKAHKSQMRWFRWGWISLGRYMVINDLRLQRIG
ncbi:MAG: hypothetical protein Q9190_007937 [Brigantiaea leucoxantha]